jgi:3-hydroxybutyryl-CoA dehydrogenase
VGVVGCGTMGVGIAQVALAAGHPVVIYDVNPSSADRAVTQIRQATERRVSKGRMDPSEREDMLERLTVAPTLADMRDCELVVEAAAEDLSIKQSIFTELEAACGETAVLTSNTSSISVTAIAAALRRPDRVVGMHFFNPAPAMRLVEVVAGVDSDPDVLASVASTAEQWGKVAVHVTSTPGFVVNRVARPFYGEALRIVQEQASDPATVDAILRESGGFRMGPFELMDLIGLDVNLAVTRSVWTALHYDPRYTPALAQEELVASGRLGRKSGRGWYDHAEGAVEAVPRTEPERPAPPAVSTVQAHGPLASLVARLETAGVETRQAATTEAGAALPEGSGAALPEGSGVELAGGGELRLTDGRTATAVAADLGRPVVLLDLALDQATASRFAVAASDACPDEVLASAIGLLQKSGAAVSVIDDVPGLVVARTVAMIVNEAADVVGTGVAGADQVDLAMLHGVNYPVGPLEWGSRWGADAVVEVLDHLAAVYRDGHHRAAPWLRRRALTGGGLRD